MSDNLASFGFKEGLPDLKFVEIKESHGIAHVVFEQVYKGINVFASSIVVSVNTKTNQVVTVINHYKPNINIKINPEINKQNALSIAMSELHYMDKDKTRKEINLIITELQNYDLKLCWLIEVETLDFTENWSVIIDATSGEILDMYENNLSAGGYTDGTGRVYGLDPATYNSTYQQYVTEQQKINACDSVVLNNLIDGGSDFYLRGKYAWSIDTLAHENDPDDFVYSPGDDEFPEVNAYYFLDAFASYVIETLGFNPTWNNDAGSNTQAVVFDPNRGGTPPGYYAPSIDYISYTEGGAEDQSIVTHEYGHALHDALIPGGIANASNDTKGISEGLSTYLGVSYRRAIGGTSFEINNMFNWAQETLRETILTPAAANYGDWGACGASSYCLMDIWASTLMNLEYTTATTISSSRLGRNVTTKLALKSLSYVSKDDDVLENVYAFFDADRDLYSSSHFDDLDYVFEDLRGFPVPPQIPARPDITGGVGNNPIISWTANNEDDLDGYKLYRQIDGGSYQVLTTLSSGTTSYTDTEVIITSGEDDPLINYAVSAFDDNNYESDMSVPRGIRSDYISKEQATITNLTPLQYCLSEAYPNPFNPLTIINYEIPEVANVKILIFDSLGNEIVQLKNTIHEPGKYRVTFTACADKYNLSSGVYFVMLKTNNYLRINKLMLLK